MRIIRILIYGMSDNRGGIENDILSWIRNKPDNFQFDFLSDIDGKLAYQDELEEIGCKFYKISNRYKHPFLRIKELKKIIKDGNYDYLHMNVMAIDDGVPILLANKTNKTNPIVHCHTTLEKKQSIKERILLFETKVLLLGNKYKRLSCGKEAGKSMFQHKEFEVIENGIDLEKFKYDSNKRRTIRLKYNINEKDIVVGHIGHFGPPKNYPFLLQAFAELVKNNNEFKLMLVGDAGLNENVITMIQDLGINEKVISVGIVDDASSYYSAMDLFFLPSVKEGVPLVVIEAQASGLPCVVSDIVTKETKISENIVYIPLEIDIAVKNINKYSKIMTNREKAEIDNRYDIRKSSKKLFDYYNNNLK